MRVLVLDFLDTNVFSLSMQNCTYFLEPLISSWDIDLITFRLSVVLSPQLGKEQLKRFAFVELEADEPADEQHGLREFLSAYQLPLKIAHEEIEFLRALRTKDRKPNALYYYRELQNLRDPVHFKEVRIENRKDAL
jgi:hypothetical protein